MYDIYEYFTLLLYYYIFDYYSRDDDEIEIYLLQNNSTDEVVDAHHKIWDHGMTPELNNQYKVNAILNKQY